MQQWRIKLPITHYCRCIAGYKVPNNNNRRKKKKKKKEKVN